MAFSSRHLASISAETVKSWFPSDCPIPNIDERVDRLREIGSVLEAEFSGLAVNMVKRAAGSAVTFVKLLLMHFPGFRDTAIYQGRLVHFYKRAQILVADIWGAYGRPVHAQDTSRHPFAFVDMDQLTMFADYRVPQILRHVGVLRYSATLVALVDSKTELAFGSPFETEIRACSVVAVEQLQQELVARCHVHILTLEVDWLLWQKGEDIKDDILPQI